MKKIDILKLVEGVEDEQDINEIVLGHDEFKNLGKFDPTKMTLDDYKGLIETNDSIKGYNQSLMDTAVSVGVASFEKNTLPKKVEEELKKKSNENKTPDQIALDEIKAELAQIKSEKTKAEMIAKYQGVLTEKKIPTKAIGLILGSNEETTDTKIALLEEIIQPLVDERVMERLGTSSYDPPVGGGTPKIKNPWTKETFNLTEQAKILKENPELATKLKAMAGK